uniref:Uncharacterized protein n=1 Tax=Cucumis melo TaxID=3656 RepID=A0A9I9EI21_CUCME
NCDFGCRTCVNVIKQFIRFCYEVFRRSPSIGLQFGDNMKLNMICSGYPWRKAGILYSLQGQSLMFFKLVQSGLVTLLDTPRQDIGAKHG